MTTSERNRHETEHYNDDNMDPTDARHDQENESFALTASALNDPSFKGQLRPRSNTAETEIGSDAASSSSSNNNTMTNPSQSSDLRRASMPPSWDAFVRQGTRLKSIFGDTLMKVCQQHDPSSSSNSSNKNKRTNDSHHNATPEQPPARKPRLETRGDAMSGLLQEQSAEVKRLQRLLKEANAESVALQATNTSLREEVEAKHYELDRAQTSARQFAENAAKARADVGLAEATAACLARTLQSLQTVVDETKKATYLLHEEQQQLVKASSAVEAKFVKKEADLARAQSALHTLRNEKATFNMREAKWTYEKSDLQRRFEVSQQDLEELRKTVAERDAVEAARKQRALKVEEDLRHAQALIKEITSGQEESAKTQATMQETILDLEKANKELHSMLTLQQEASRKETARLNEALTKSEKEAQSLRIQNESSEEDYERLRLDKEAVDKLNRQCKSQIVRLEVQLKDAATSAPLSEQTNETPRRLSAGLPFTLIPLGGSNASELLTSVSSQGSTCCICFKGLFGMMKSCQCGKSDCNKRAHMTCANRIQPGTSVSHPGTPAPPLPLVFCGNAATSALKPAGSSGK